MKKTSFLMLVLAVSLFGSGLVRASSISDATSRTFKLDCLLNSHSCLTFTGGTSFGTFKFTDGVGADAGKVIIDVVLASPAHKLLGIWFNYDDALFSNASAFVMSPDAVAVNENNKNAGSFFNFDLEAPPTGNFGNVSSVSEKISLASTTLNHETFHFFAVDGSPATSSDHRSWVGVHIGNINCGAVLTCVPGTAGGSSLFVGSRVGPGDCPDCATVPEPGSLLLLGAGLAGLVGWRRRRKAS